MGPSESDQIPGELCKGLAGFCGETIREVWGKVVRQAAIKGTGNGKAFSIMSGSDRGSGTVFSLCATQEDPGLGETRVGSGYQPVTDWQHLWRALVFPINPHLR